MSSAGIAVVVAIAAALIAFWGVITQRVLARRRATIDHISNLLNDHDYIKARRRFVEIAKSDEKLLPFAAEGCPDQDGLSSIDLVLNNYELIAIGIQRGILDFVIVKRYARAIIISHYEAAAPYIVRLRTNSRNDQYYKEFETMKDWMAGGTPKAYGRFWSLLF